MAQKMDVERLLLGDSRMEQGVEAALLRNTYNMAHPSQILAYDSLLLAYYQAHLPRLKQVVVALTPFRMREGLKASGTRTQLYKGLYIPPKNPADWVRAQFYCLQFSPREAWKLALSDFAAPNPNKKGSRPNQECTLPTPELAEARLLELEAYAEPLTEAPNWRRLAGMQAFCKKHGLDLRIILPPTSSAMRALTTQQNKELLDKCRAMKLTNADFSEAVPDSFFFDPDHVCAKGALVFTHALKAYLENETKRAESNR
jgi:hypothetical protein